MKQYIVTEEQIKAVEDLLTSMCNSYGKPASLQAAIVAVTAGLRNHEYVEQESAWVTPMWSWSYHGKPLSDEELPAFLRQKTVDQRQVNKEQLGAKDDTR